MAFPMAPYSGQLHFRDTEQMKSTNLAVSARPKAPEGWKTENARSWFDWLTTNGSCWRVWPVPLASVDVMSPSRYHY